MSFFIRNAFGFGVVREQALKTACDWQLALLEELAGCGDGQGMGGGASALVFCFFLRP